MTLSFFNPGDQTLTGLRYWGYLPMKRGSAQRTASVRTSLPAQLTEDAWGHQVLMLEFDRLLPYARKVVQVTTVVDMQSAPWLEPLDTDGRWLQPEPLVQIGDPGIRQLALSLARDDKATTSRAIYEWVSGNLEYAGYLEEAMGAVEALKQRRGDCTEYADLVVALARASGIPARRIGGYVVDRDGPVKPADYHDWAELHVDGAWRIVDAQKRNWGGPVQHYVAFHMEGCDAVPQLAGHPRYRIVGGMRLE